MASGSGLESVAHPADGANAGGFPATVELLAQVGDVQIHYVGVDVWGAAPYGVEQDRAREDLPRVLEQCCKQSEFLSRQFDPLASTPNHVAERVECHVAGCENCLVPPFSPRPPGKGPHAGQEFGKGEGFWEVVVGAGV